MTAQYLLHALLQFGEREVQRVTGDPTFSYVSLVIFSFYYLPRV